MLKLIQLQRLNRFLSAATQIPAYRPPGRFALEGCACSTATAENVQPFARHIHHAAVLRKYNKNSRRHGDSDSEDEDNADFKDERDSKVVKTKVNSLRADLLLKAGLGMARNKIEAIFYDSKIRVNGRKINKKSVQLNVGDEIDVIRGFSQSNPAHIVVARVVILSASAREEDLSVSLRRYRSLLVENYAGANVYKSSEVVDH